MQKLKTRTAELLSNQLLTEPTMSETKGDSKQKLIILQKRDISQIEMAEIIDHNKFHQFQISETKKDLKDLLNDYNCIMFDLRNKQIMQYWAHSRNQADCPVVEINKKGSAIPKENQHGANIRRKTIVTGSRDRTQFLQRILADHLPSIPSPYKRFFGALAKLLCS